MNRMLRTSLVRTAAVAGLALSALGLAPRAEAYVDIAAMRANASANTKGDYNGDGFADLAAVSRDGSITVTYGSVNGLSTTVPVAAQIWSGGTFSVPAWNSIVHSGTSGDFNGDGYTDLAVLGIGEVWVINGSAAGLTCIGAQRYLPTFFFDSYGGNLPYYPIHNGALVAGDFDNDGIADLAVGGEHMSFGRSLMTVSVVFGNRTRLGMGRTRRSLDVPGFSTGDEMTAAFSPMMRFGVGKIDGRPGDDLVIGTPREGLLYGSIRFVSGSTVNGIDFANAKFIDQNSAGVADSNELGDFFGASIAVGDFNRDGFADVAVGAPGESVVSQTAELRSAGAVHMFMGTASGISGSKPILQSFGTVSVADMAVEANDRFGATLASGDFNGDGFADLAMGAPGETVNGQTEAGAIVVLHGGTTSLSATAGPGKRMVNLGIDARTGDQFGHSLMALDFGWNGISGIRYADLAIGIPFKEVGAVVDAGMVMVTYGSPNGFAGVGTRTFTQSSAGMPSTATTNNQFGTQVF